MYISGAAQYSSVLRVKLEKMTLFDTGKTMTDSLETTHLTTDKWNFPKQTKKDKCFGTLFMDTRKSSLKAGIGYRASLGEKEVFTRQD